MAVNPSLDLILTPLRGTPKTLRQHLTTFHLLLAVIDPYSSQSRALIPTAERILHTFSEADCRVAFMMASGATEAKRALGKISDERLIFLDQDHTFANGVKLERMPALIHLAMDGSIAGIAEGWNPDEWQAVTDGLAAVTRWRGPVLPGPYDPAAFTGSPIS